MLINGKEKVANFPHEMANQCPTCGELFNSIKGFDRHRRGRFELKRRCLTVDEMISAKMIKNSLGYWITEEWHGRGLA